MKPEYQYAYIDHDGRIFSSVDSYDRSADVELDQVESYQDLIKEHLLEKVPFVLCTKDGRCYNDVVFADFRNDTFVKIICKWVNPGYTSEIPTFGNPDSKTGLVEAVIPYDKLGAFVQMNPSPTGEMMQKLKTKYPKYFEMWSNTNITEAVSPSDYLNAKKA